MAVVGRHSLIVLLLLGITLQAAVATAAAVSQQDTDNWEESELGEWPSTNRRALANKIVHCKPWTNCNGHNNVQGRVCINGVLCHPADHLCGTRCFNPAKYRCFRGVLQRISRRHLAKSDDSLSPCRPRHFKTQPLPVPSTTPAATQPTVTSTPSTTTTSPSTTAPPPTTTGPSPTTTTASPTTTAAPPTASAAPPTNTAAPPTNTVAPPTSTAAPPTTTAASPTTVSPNPTATNAPSTVSPTASSSTSPVQTTTASPTTTAPEGTTEPPSTTTPTDSASATPAPTESATTPPSTTSTPVTSIPATAAPSTATPASSTSAPGGGGFISSNPYSGAVMYVNPDYTKEVDSSAAKVASASADAALIAKARNLPTAVWLSNIAAIAGDDSHLGLSGHLDAAVAQAAAAKDPVVITIVVYDLPNRDCAALASNGELSGTAGLETYKSQYIDVIYTTLKSKPEYANLRISLVMEPDSLPNAVTNADLPKCAVAVPLYMAGITYALGKLGTVSNAYIYLDIAHSGWLGWPDNMSKAVTLYTQLVKGLSIKIRGFATDTANYTPLEEPYVSPSNITLLQGNFYQYNPVFDEVTFAKTLSTQFEAAGLSGFGFIIDTSRSGWKAVNNGQPIDRRTQRGNWCNVEGAGLGVRPQASPNEFDKIDALVYVKPPGESDGISHADGLTPTHFDGHCDPTNPVLNAMSGAPSAGDWFHDEFMMLIQNANPAL